MRFSVLRLPAKLMEAGALLPPSRKRREKGTPEGCAPAGEAEQALLDKIRPSVIPRRGGNQKISAFRSFVLHVVLMIRFKQPLQIRTFFGTHPADETLLPLGI